MPRPTANPAGREFVGSAFLCWASLHQVLERELPIRVVGPPLTSQTLRVLKFLSRLQPQAIGEIARFLGVSRSAASKIVDNMVRGRWLRRAQSIPDRRVWKVCLTSASARLLHEYDRAADNEIAALLGGRSPAELRKTAAVMDGIALQIVATETDSGRDCLRCGSYVREHCPLQPLMKERCPYQRHAGLGDRQNPSKRGCAPRSEKLPRTAAPERLRAGAARGRAQGGGMIREAR